MIPLKAATARALEKPARRRMVSACSPMAIGASATSPASLDRRIPALRAGAAPFFAPVFRPQARAARPARSAVLATGALQPEEIALPAVAALLLVDEVQPARVEGLEPLLPADVPEILATAAEIEPQHAEVVLMLGALDGRRRGAARLGPFLDDLVMGRGQA